MNQNYATGTLGGSGGSPCWTGWGLSDISPADLGSIHFTCRSLSSCEL